MPLLGVGGIYPGAVWMGGSQPLQYNDALAERVGVIPNCGN